MTVFINGYVILRESLTKLNIFKAYLKYVLDPDDFHCCLVVLNWNVNFLVDPVNSVSCSKLTLQKRPLKSTTEKIYWISNGCHVKVCQNFVLDFFFCSTTFWKSPAHKQNVYLWNLRRRAIPKFRVSPRLSKPYCQIKWQLSKTYW
jgi:hypothetical protein